MIRDVARSLDSTWRVSHPWNNFWEGPHFWPHMKRDGKFIWQVWVMGGISQRLQKSLVLPQAVTTRGSLQNDLQPPSRSLSCNTAFLPPTIHLWYWHQCKVLASWIPVRFMPLYPRPPVRLLSRTLCLQWVPLPFLSLGHQCQTLCSPFWVSKWIPK